MKLKIETDVRLAPNLWNQVKSAVDVLKVINMSPIRVYLDGDANMLSLEEETP